MDYMQLRIPVDEKALLVFAMSFLADVMWALCILKTTQGQAWSAFAVGFVLNELNGNITIKYTHDPLYVHAYALGAAAGVLVAIPLDAWQKRQNRLGLFCTRCVDATLVESAKGQQMLCPNCLVQHDLTGVPWVRPETRKAMAEDYLEELREEGIAVAIYPAPLAASS